MIKEFIICMIIVISIFIGNGITQGYSRSSIEDINSKLVSLRDEIENNGQYEDDVDEFDNNELNEENINIFKDELDNNYKNEDNIKIHQDEIDKQWKDMFSKLAYYIEHEELEKVSKNLENLKTYISLKKYEESIKEINEVIYILNHIEDKYSFNLQNIF